MYTPPVPVRLTFEAASQLLSSEIHSSDRLRAVNYPILLAARRSLRWYMFRCRANGSSVARPPPFLPIHGLLKGSLGACRDSAVVWVSHRQIGVLSSNGVHPPRSGIHGTGYSTDAFWLPWWFIRLNRDSRSKRYSWRWRIESIIVIGFIEGNEILSLGGSFIRRNNFRESTRYRHYFGQSIMVWVQVVKIQSPSPSVRVSQYLARLRGWWRTSKRRTIN